MADFTSAFKEEVRRLARKEAKESTSKLVQDIARLKKTVVDQKRRIAKLEGENRKIVRVTKIDQPKIVTPAEEKVQRARITGRNIRDLRARLGLTQAELAALLGVSGQSVYQWERAEDERLNLRSATKAAVFAARSLGMREARRRLEAGS